MPKQQCQHIDGSHGNSFSVVKTSSNWIQLFVCSSPRCKLQLLFWYQIKLLNKIWRTRNADVSMSDKWQRNFCCFWRVFLKIQINSKFDETWFIVSTMKGTSTHLKESNWDTIWILKIKIHKHCRLAIVDEFQT